MSLDGMSSPWRFEIPLPYKVLSVIRVDKNEISFCERHEVPKIGIFLGIFSIEFCFHQSQTNVMYVFTFSVIP